MTKGHFVPYTLDAQSTYMSAVNKAVNTDFSHEAPWEVTVMENALYSLSLICKVKGLGQATSWVHLSSNSLSILSYSSFCVSHCDLAEQRLQVNRGNTAPWVLGWVGHWVQ